MFKRGKITEAELPQLVFAFYISTSREQPSQRPEIGRKSWKNHENKELYISNFVD